MYGLRAFRIPLRQDFQQPQRDDENIYIGVQYRYRRTLPAARGAPALPPPLTCAGGGIVNVRLTSGAQHLAPHRRRPHLAAALPPPPRRRLTMWLPHGLAAGVTAAQLAAQVRVCRFAAGAGGACQPLEVRGAKLVNKGTLQVGCGRWHGQAAWLQGASGGGGGGGVCIAEP